MYIPQVALDYLRKHVVPQKVVVIYGARRVGKTTLLKKFLETEENYLFISGEDVFARKEVSSGSIDKLKQFIGKNTLLVIDEAQYIPDIGLNLKLIVDHIEGIKVIVTGSSSFDLQQHIGDPLTGRKYVTTIYPVSQQELSLIETPLETKARLETRLIYGSYPETILLEGNHARQEYLHELVSSYLCKDILVFEGIKKSQKLIDLLVLLAFQIGKEVSISELGTQLSLNKTTVEKYLDLLQKTFVIVNIRGFSRNLRKEVTKSSRYYFCDNGIRNSLINNFNPLSIRDDVGALWENYLAIERLKKQQHQLIWSRNYFWRTYDQKEIDWVEDREGKLFGYEFKWGNKIVKVPKLWTDTYENGSFECINQDNYLGFIT